jgi:cation diffusion facilitator CzcD-associated flavoprotein CzcO
MPIPSKTSTTTDSTAARLEGSDVEVCIVGSGFGGLGMAIQLERAGIASFVIVEQAAEVGGTWRDNDYPGCACDIPSHLYSFSFAPKADWSRMYPPQAEIWAYLQGCVQAFGLGSRLRLGTRMLQAVFDEARSLWQVQTSTGSFTARYLVSAIGGLSRPAIPVLRGIEVFQGEVFHSSQWKHDARLEGRRVAVIGTGASAIQFVPQLVPRVAALHLFQRTAAWVLPKYDREISRAERWCLAHVPGLRRAFRAFIYGRQELRGLGFTTWPSLLEQGRKMALAHLHAQVAQPELRAKLTPHYTFGCKRVLLSNDYYPALAQPHVEVVTSGVRELRPQSIVDEQGVERPIDVLIYGTGFRPTDLLAPMRIVGRHGLSLDDAWGDGMHAYNGTAVPGFPNLFLLSGPNTGLGHNSIVFMIEAQIRHVLDCLREARALGARAIEVSAAAERSYNDELQRRMRSTVWSSGCKSWYMDARGRNVTLWPGLSLGFWLRLRRLDTSAYHWRGGSRAPALSASAAT